jgi:hypothetical protein
MRRKTAKKPRWKFTLVIGCSFWCLELKICREKCAEKLLFRVNESATVAFVCFPGESSKLSISLMEEGNLSRLSSNNGWF